MTPGAGSLAESCVVSDVDLVPLAHPVADAAVAALGPSAVAAWACLVRRARLQPGERVLVLGAGGAVGQAASERPGCSARAGWWRPAGRPAPRSGPTGPVPTRSSHSAPSRTTTR